MKLLKSWLNDYLQTDVSNEKLAGILVSLGADVDDINSSFDDSVVVARITGIKPHPNADRLRIATVTTGMKEYEVVCGAPNIETGQVVPLALVGAKLGGTILEEAAIRGVRSKGMLCAEDELGLGSDHKGIKILDESFRLGDPLSKYIRPETVFDLEITPNRGDLLSHLGLARDLAPVIKKPVTKQKYYGIIPDAKRLELKIKIEDNENCYQYYGVILSDLSVGESPEWLKNRLIKCGMRPINNIVDVTNYVMLDLGQPLHAFDAQKVADKEIIVRQARSGEKLTTIDGQTRSLETGMLLITDKDKPLAVAGIMGGGESEVNETTTRIILEAAQFNPKSVRVTAKKLNLSSDASYRFERGIDPSGVSPALEKAAKMIVELAKGKIASGVVSAGRKPEEISLKIDYKKINALLGTKFSADKIDEILKSLGFSLDGQTCRVPSWRHDINAVEDLAEEAARIFGYENIPQTTINIAGRAKRDWFYKKEFIKDILAENGFSEMINYPFLSENDLAVVNIKPDELLVVANPVNIENKYLRKSLLPGLLKSVSKNPSFDPVLAFEIGQVFSKESEETHLAIVASGKQAQKAISGAIEAISVITGTGADEFHLRSLPREDLTRYKIRKPVTFAAETVIFKLIQNLRATENELVLKIGKKLARYRAVSKYPSIVRDVAFIVDETVGGEDVQDSIYGVSEMINRVELFDEFVSGQFGAGKKNIAYHLNLQHQEKTLTDREADEILDRVVKTIEENFGAKLRE